MQTLSLSAGKTHQSELRYWAKDEANGLGTRLGWNVTFKMDYQNQITFPIPQASGIVLWTFKSYA